MDRKLDGRPSPKCCHPQMASPWMSKVTVVLEPMYVSNRRAQVSEAPPGLRPVLESLSIYPCPP